MNKTNGLFLNENELGTKTEMLIETSLFLNEEENAGFLLKKLDREASAKIVKSEMAKIKLNDGWKWATTITPEIKEFARKERMVNKIVTLGVNTVDVIMLSGVAVMVYYANRGLFKFGEIVAVNNEKEIRMSGTTSKKLDGKIKFFRFKLV